MQVYFQYNALCQLCKLFYSFHSSRLLPLPFPVPCTVSRSISPVNHYLIYVILSYVPMFPQPVYHVPYSLSISYIQSKPPRSPIILSYFLFLFFSRFLYFPFSFPYIHSKPLVG